MHLRTIVLFSIGLNLVLGIGWGIYYFNNSVYSRRPIIRQASAGSMPHIPPPANPERQKSFDWQQVESDDYATYIQNLRAIKCPEHTIRDIIVADLNYHFAQRRNRQTLTNDVNWWQSDSQNPELHQRQQNLEMLDRERRLLLSELLGENWENREAKEDPAAKSAVYLGGPVLGKLSEENQNAVHKVAAAARDRIEEYIETQSFLGEPIDPVQLAQLRKEMRTQLSSILNPQQMEEFLLRYSETAQEMRRELRGLKLTPEEFRNLFRVRDPLDHELAMLGGASNSAAAGRIRTLQNQTDLAVRQILGPERYIEFKLNEDPVFQETRTHADQLGATPETMFSIYEITREFLDEEQRIRNDTTLSAEARIEALATAQADQQKALQRILGTEGFQRWQRMKK